MPINYALFENNLTSDPKDYAAQVKIIASVDLDRVAQRIIDQGSTVTKPDILAVLEDSIKACESLLLEGNRVNFGGLVELFPRIKGIFNGITDTYDPSRHKVDVAANPGNRVRETVRQGAVVAKQETILPMPSPLEFRDLASGDINETITAGTIGTLTGHRLKYDPAQADEGIFLVDLDTQAAIKVTAVQKNKPSQLVFLVPTITGTGYRIEVRARINGGENLRTGALNATLLT